MIFLVKKCSVPRYNQTQNLDVLKVPQLAAASCPSCALNVFSIQDHPAHNWCWRDHQMYAQPFYYRRDQSQHRVSKCQHTSKCSQMWRALYPISLALCPALIRYHRPMLVWVAATGLNPIRPNKISQVGWQLHGNKLLSEGDGICLTVVMNG